MAAQLETLNSLAQRAQERDERVREPLSCDTSFQGNADGNISDLAKAAYPENPEEQQRYSAKIKASLETHLQAGQNIQTLWAYLKEKGCRTSSVINGYLRFFTGAKGEGEIAIEQLMKPFRMEAESNLHKTKMEARNEVLGSTRTQLASLMAELQAENPNLPK
jgi:hypothetical protein